MVREDDGDDASQRPANRLQEGHALVDVFLHLLELRGGQARGLVEKVPADVQLPDIVKQRGGARVLDAAR